MCRGVEVKLHAFLTTALYGSVPLHAAAVLGLFSTKDAQIHIGYEAGRIRVPLNEAVF
jgi:hypothetical protein